MLSTIPTTTTVQNKEQQSICFQFTNK